MKLKKKEFKVRKVLSLTQVLSGNRDKTVHITGIGNLPSNYEELEEFWESKYRARDAWGQYFIHSRSDYILIVFDFVDTHPQLRSSSKREVYTEDIPSAYSGEVLSEEETSSSAVPAPKVVPSSKVEKVEEIKKEKPQIEKGKFLNEKPIQPSFSPGSDPMEYEEEVFEDEDYEDEEE